MRSTTAFAYWTTITALAVSVSAFQPPPFLDEQGPKVINVKKIKGNFNIQEGGQMLRFSSPKTMASSWWAQKIPAEGLFWSKKSGALRINL